MTFFAVFMFFFFKQKTAYEMRISDWSSDVCSSDLVDRDRDPLPAFLADPRAFCLERLVHEPIEERHVLQPAAGIILEQVAQNVAARGNVSVKPDEADPLVGSAHGLLGQFGAAHIGLLVVARLEHLPDLLLALMVLRSDEHTSEL